LSRIEQRQIDEDLGRIDTGIRQLKVQYDMFKAGSLKTEPRELRVQLERLIRKYAHGQIGNYAQNFRFNALVSRFTSFAELWNKQVRSMEEGTHRHASVAETMGIKERLVARCRIVEPSENQSDLKRMHSRFVDAQRRNGVGDAKIPTYDSFLRSIASQTQKLRREAGCESVELRLIERDNGVQLKARPAR
jgi:hypothetical protein